MIPISNPQGVRLPDVKVVSDKGWLRLQFSSRISRAAWGKRQFYKALGRQDTESNREWANRIVLAIQEDIDHSDPSLFDPTLNKYLSPKIINLPSASHNPKLGVLWDDFCLWKFDTGRIAETTYKTRYRRTFLNWLSPYLESEVSRELVEKLRGDLMEGDNFKPNIKKLFSALIEMGDRAVFQETLTQNFFRILGEIHFRQEKKSKQLQEIEDYRAFSLEERDLIIKSFYESEKEAERQAGFLVEFLFLTGCRLGEAFALKWRDIKQNWIVFDESYSSETKITKGTKTDTIRIFKTTGYDNLLDLIQRIKLRNEFLSLDDYVFIKTNFSPYSRFNLSAVWLGVDKSKGEKKILFRRCGYSFSE